MTDTDKKKAYHAEFDLRAIYDLADKVSDWSYDFYGYTMTLPRERKFGDLDSIRNYYKKVLELTSVREAFPGKAAPGVAFTHGTQHAYHRSGTVYFNDKNRGGRWQMREIVVLHELAHYLSPVSGHGPEFRGVFAFLTGAVMGPETEMLLGSLFHQYCGVYNCVSV